MSYSKKYKKNKNDENVYDKGGKTSNAKLDKTSIKKNDSDSKNINKEIKKNHKKADNSNDKNLTDKRKPVKEKISTKFKEIIDDLENSVKAPIDSLIDDAKEKQKDQSSDTINFQSEIGLFLRVLQQINFRYVFPFIGLVLFNTIFSFDLPGIFTFAAFVFALVHAYKAVQKAKFHLLKIKVDIDEYIVFYKKYADTFFIKIPNDQFYFELINSNKIRSEKSKIEIVLTLGNKKRQFRIYEKGPVIIEYFDDLLLMSNRKEISIKTYHLLNNNLNLFNGKSLKIAKRIIALMKN